MKRGPQIEPIISLWILIALSLCIYILISFSDDFKIMNYEPTKGSFREMLTAGREETHEDSVDVPIERVDTLEIAEEEKLIQPDTTVRNVLIFGDSMTHNLGMSIAKYGTKNGYKVTSVTWESSSIPGWSDSGKIEQYLEAVKPDFVFISLGSNEMELKHFDVRGKNVKKILEKLGDIPFIWVGPPLWKEDRGLYAMLEKNLNGAPLFRTAQDINIERGPDHVHPTRRGADHWADTLMSWQLHTRHPLPAEKPDSGVTTRGHKIIYLHPDD